jgi:hypothetical protein
MDKLDDILLGFGMKVGATKDKVFVGTDNIESAIEAIKSLMDSVLGADEPIDGNDSTDYRNELRAELRERIKSL